MFVSQGQEKVFEMTKLLLAVEAPWPNKLHGFVLSDRVLGTSYERFNHRYLS